MIKLYLVGATDDLKNLVFSRRRGAKSGTFMVPIEDQLQQTLNEVARLRQEAASEADEVLEGLSPPKAAVLTETEAGGEVLTLSVGGEAAGDGDSRTSSQLSPKEIQSLLRAGKTVEEVARMAETDISWIVRFNGPIVAERGGVVEAVKSGLISRSRLGRSRMTVGEAIAANLRKRKINLPHEILDEGWRAIRRDGYWEVTFRYLSRGQPREARFAYDLEKRSVRHLNPLASQLGWYGESPSDPSEAKASATPEPPGESEVAAAGRSAKSAQEKKSPAPSTLRPSRRPARVRRPAPSD
ncbi:MAG: septation protein SepH [Actinomycetota bacterium]